MKRIFLICLLAVFLMPSNSRADISRLSDSHRKLLVDDMTSFRFLNSKNEIPSAVLALCADTNGRLADIGENWEATDLITDDKLPQKRLIWAAEYKNYYLVHYERGGRGHSFHILLAQTKGSEKADVLWRAVGDRYADILAFSKALKNNQMDDDPKFAY